MIALDDERRVVCFDLDYLLPIYNFDFTGQFVLFELDKISKRILSIDLVDEENRSIAMRTFKGMIFFC